MTKAGDQRGPRKQPCEAGRHRFDAASRSCRCGVTLDEPGQGLLFNHDPKAESEARLREAVSGQREMFYGEVRPRGDGRTA